jgi:hypothetical protein
VLLRLEIACYSAPSRLALDAHCSPKKTQFITFRGIDEFLVFFFKYIEPNQRVIKESPSRRLFETLTQNSFDIWLGFAFERFCLKHAGMPASVMGFADDLLLASPYFEKNDKNFRSIFCTSGQIA